MSEQDKVLNLLVESICSIDWNVYHPVNHIVSAIELKDKIHTERAKHPEKSIKQIIKELSLQ